MVLPAPFASFNAGRISLGCACSFPPMIGAQTLDGPPELGNTRTHLGCDFRQPDGGFYGPDLAEADGCRRTCGAASAAADALSLASLAIDRGWGAFLIRHRKIVIGTRQQGTLFCIPPLPLGFWYGYDWIGTPPVILDAVRRLTIGIKFVPPAGVGIRGIQDRFFDRQLRHSRHPSRGCPFCGCRLFIAPATKVVVLQAPLAGNLEGQNLTTAHRRVRGFLCHLQQNRDLWQSESGARHRLVPLVSNPRYFLAGIKHFAVWFANGLQIQGRYHVSLAKIVARVRSQPQTPLASRMAAKTQTHQIYSSISVAIGGSGGIRTHGGLPPTLS